jgi:hypothetical protein
MQLIDQVVRLIGSGTQLDPTLSNLCGGWHVGRPERRKATTVEPMKPMEPMKPPSEDKWWPPDLGQPSTSGSQNDMRYAFFPEKRRLLIEQDGKLATYDSADHRISGVSGGPVAAEPKLQLGAPGAAVGALNPRLMRQRAAPPKRPFPTRLACIKPCTSL